MSRYIVEIPCKVGDKLFFTGNPLHFAYKVMQVEVIQISIDSDEMVPKIHVRADDDRFQTAGLWTSFYIDAMGDSLFFTREEAEKKLEEIENDKA